MCRLVLNPLVTDCLKTKILSSVFSELSEGSVGQNMLVDGSTVTLLPRAETGLIVSIIFLHSIIIASVPDP